MHLSSGRRAAVRSRVQSARIVCPIRVSERAVSRRVIRDESSEHRLYNLSLHVSKAVVASLELERQTSVINAETMQNGSVQVMDVYWIFDNVVAELVRRP